MKNKVINKIDYNKDNSVSINGKVFSFEYINKIYNVDNKSQEEMLSILGVSQSTFDKIKKFLNIKKDTKQIAKNRESNLVKKYGVKNVSSLKQVQDKKKQLSLKKYGVENISQAKEVREHKKNTMMKHYGKEYYFQTKEFKDNPKLLY